ncbi:MAG: hypothetical protein QGG71_25655 [Pirellulaceae bacterium]|jgi:hypothetical protein|nr:hypothetical protein [Pirellulaceae bacterium]
MGRIEELITDHFVKRIVMYVGVNEFREVRNVLMKRVVMPTLRIAKYDDN